MKKLTFVDLETTGLYPDRDKIIEIGIITVVDNVITDTYQTLINPGIAINGEVTSITGIRNTDLISAPKLEEVADIILAKFETSTFVAHNASFDYDFLSFAFKNINKEFALPRVCTIRLTKALFPHYLRYNLDSLATKYGVDIGNRHRAVDDIKLLYNVFLKLREKHGVEKFEKAFSEVLQFPPTNTITPIKASNLELF